MRIQQHTAVGLPERIRLARDALLNGLDPTQANRPYWCCACRDAAPVEFEHCGGYDYVHAVPRVMHGLSFAEAVLGAQTDNRIWGDLTRYMFALFDRGPLPAVFDDRDGGVLSNLHDVREVVHGLTALIARGDERAQACMEGMIGAILDAMDEDGTLHAERIPGTAKAVGHPPCDEGRAADALVRYVRLTGDEQALELARRIARGATRRAFTSEGTLTEMAGGHVHSINAMLAGILDLALLTGDRPLLLSAKAVFDVGLPPYHSSFGWSMENRSREDLRGEINNTGDLLRCALLLGRAGYIEYFARAERILRSHLLPSQVIDVEDVSDDSHAAGDCRRSLAERFRGGFGFPTPSDYLNTPDAAITVTDITSGGLDALCEARRAALTRDEGTASLNVLVSLSGEGFRVESCLSEEGLLRIASLAGEGLRIRIPPWVRRDELRLTVDAADRAPQFAGEFLVIPAAGQPWSAEVRFPLDRARTRETIRRREFTIDWLGDRIVAMSPTGPLLPMFPPCSA